VQDKKNLTQRGKAPAACWGKKVFRRVDDSVDLIRFDPISKQTTAPTFYPRARGARRKLAAASEKRRANDTRHFFRSRKVSECLVN
jgi:hypothetical protein